MILEGIVTTLGEDGRVNISPMGPIVSPDWRTLTLRPFKSSQTYKNLRVHREGVFHVTDDAEMLARAAIGDITPELKRAQAVNGWIIAGACRAYELRVAALDETSERVSIVTEVVRVETLREHFGFNRAKHAVVEAAILATRVHLLAREEILAKLNELAVIVQKTGGDAEARAYALLRAFVEAAPHPRPSSVRIRTGSRLHLGLIWPGRGGRRRFGGAGVMIAEPGVALEASPAAKLQVEGPLQARVEACALACGADRFPVHIRLLNAPGEHCGLGTGTQLSLAVARALAILQSDPASVAELAVQTERGRRSAIGVHGFQYGGFLIDGGKGDATELAPLLMRLEVPASWRIVLLSPPAGPGLSGDVEEATFLELDNDAQTAAEALSRVLLLGLAPAVAECDLRAFGESLHEFGRRSGELFKQAQGGAFASPLTQDLVDAIRSWGIAGVAQSSWGPAVFAVTESDDEANSLAAKIRTRFGDTAGEIRVTSALNRGAAVEARYS